MHSNDHMIYLAGYPEHLVRPVHTSIASGAFGPWLRARFPEAHTVRTDRALFEYVDELRSRHMRNAPPVSKVGYDGKLQSVRQALGTHTRIARVQGGKLKTKREIRIATIFRETPPEFLRMIVAHELAHLREPDHDKAFYQLCNHIADDYHQREFEVRAYLCYLASGGQALWGGVAAPEQSA